VVNLNDAVKLAVPENPHPRTKHEVDLMTRRLDIAIQNFRNER